MKNLFRVLIAAAVIAACSGNKKPKTMDFEFEKGTFGYDSAFLAKHKIESIILSDQATGASILLVPAWQGRVMTSSADGMTGNSFGWINYRHIESGTVSQQFNPTGGEERLWLGPEGGPFSIYFRKGDEQVFSNWKVPAELDTEPFELVSKTPASALFRKNFSLANASGTEISIGIERSVSLLDKMKSESSLGVSLEGLSFVGYESVNTLENTGSNSWNNQSGFLSLWMLGMFNPSDRGVVFIPFKPGNEKVVTDDYFGKVPPDRLIITDSMLFFRTDGKYRSKIGISHEGAKPLAAGYDPDKKSLTIIWFSLPEGIASYVNSKWGTQKDPLRGDVVNSYNDGPVDDGSTMGPFYEIESSSPAALLAPGEKLTHTQRTFHITGDELKLSTMTEKLFGVTIDQVKSVF